MDLFNRQRVRDLEAKVKALESQRLEVLVKVAERSVEIKTRETIGELRADLLRMTDARNFLLDAKRCSCGRFVPKLKA